ncbi:response regulator [Mesorhizobium sp. BR1-1-16]|uniref:response regulator n=1 Tax=Mesorhizobium sp. BR1-1-16 TaxID=2876653 RepID=UPI001CC958D5|nr:response regulator [Mesorhizobium sp. BR1-1-16]MBZ9937769.1 response regulator [Mesorhizobium sp. BR1-1-16]
MDTQLRVFVVEDEVLLQMQLEVFLDEAGHLMVGSATTMHEAITRAPTAGADLALVDIHLADGPTGVEVGRALADMGLPVVFMTANARRIPADFSGAIGIISKPYSQTGVAEALKFLVSAVKHPPPEAPLPPCLTLAPALAERWRVN